MGLLLRTALFPSLPKLGASAGLHAGSVFVQTCQIPVSASGGDSREIPGLCDIFPIVLPYFLGKAWRERVGRARD